MSIDIGERYEAAAALLREHGWNEMCFDAIIGDLFPRLAPVLDELDRLRATEARARTQVSQSADAMHAMRESAIRDIEREREKVKRLRAAPTMAHGPLPDGREGERVVVLIGGTPVVMPWGDGKWGPSHGWHVVGFVCTWARLPREAE